MGCGTVWNGEFMNLTEYVDKGMQPYILNGEIEGGTPSIHRFNQQSWKEGVQNIPRIIF